MRIVESISEIQTNQKVITFNCRFLLVNIRLIDNWMVE